MMKARTEGYSSASVTRRQNAPGVNMTNSSVLMLASVILLHFSIQDGSQRPWVEWADLVVTIIIAVIAYYLFRRGTRDTRSASLISLKQILFLVSFGALPFLTDIVLRRLVPHGNPLEIQVTMVIRNMMFGLVVVPGNTTGRLATFISLFLAIFSALVSTSTTTNVLFAVYALLGLWWLMGDYWQRISSHFPDESTTEIPYSARVGAIGLVFLCLAGGAFAFQSSAVTSAIAGIMPSSGGTGGSDPFARGGVGDGEQMVGATEDANSFGPIESELFLESQQPTLYDMFIENYFDEVKKRKSRSRAIPLSSKEKQKQNHNRFAQNKKSSREFSAIRRESAQRKRDKKIKDTDSKALVYVAGRTPLHLGLAVFDQWDGQNLSLGDNSPEPRLDIDLDIEQRKWAIWDRSAFSECFSQPERHLLKVINLNSPTLPAPPTLTAVHIDKLHEAKFFKWEGGLLRVRGDRVPSLTVLHVRSRPLHKQKLHELALRRTASESKESSDADDPRIADSLHALASSWTEGAATDWDCVESVCRQLRTFDHDPGAVVPEDAPDAVEHFLLESHRGPDFLFATSAAVLLRSLGFESRVVSGLYADPTNYDRTARATAVFDRDVHFWTEVQTQQGHWVPAEPTPGYQVLYARQTFLQKVANTISNAVGQIADHPVTSALVTAIVIATVACRGWIYSLVAVLWWKLRLNTAPRQQVLHSVRLLQRLSGRKISARQAGQTLDQWLGSLSSLESTAVREFRNLVSWACYGSAEQPATESARVRQICIESINQIRGRV